jgi:sortase A
MARAGRIFRLLPASMASSRSAAVLLAAVGLGLFAWGAYIPAKAWAAQALLERAWDQSRANKAPSGILARPWPWADMTPVARLGIERLGGSSIVLAGASGSTLAFGPGHVDGTALPGQPGHSVVSAHRDTHFAYLEDASVGDLIRVEQPSGATSGYRIVERRVIDSRNEQVLLHPEANLLTLITCYPFEDWTPGGPLRLIVTAEKRF